MKHLSKNEASLISGGKGERTCYCTNNVAFKPTGIKLSPSGQPMLHFDNAPNSVGCVRFQDEAAAAYGMTPEDFCIFICRYKGFDNGSLTVPKGMSYTKDGDL